MLISMYNRIHAHLQTIFNKVVALKFISFLRFYEFLIKNIKIGIFIMHYYLHSFLRQYGLITAEIFKNIREYSI